MKEALIRKKAVDELTSKGWIVNTFVRSRFGSNTVYTPVDKKPLRGDDAFTIFDAICWRGNKKIYIQWTAKEGMPARRKKIKEFKKKYGVCGVVELWGYNKKTKKFIKEKI